MGEMSDYNTKTETIKEKYNNLKLGYYAKKAHICKILLKCDWWGKNSHKA